MARLSGVDESGAVGHRRARCHPEPLAAAASQLMPHITGPALAAVCKSSVFFPSAFDASVCPVGWALEQQLALDLPSGACFVLASGARDGQKAMAKSVIYYVEPEVRARRAFAEDDLAGLCMG